MSDRQIIVSDWRKVWRYYSTWALAVLAVVPDIYAALVAAGLVTGDDMPDIAAWTVRGLAVVGIVSRFINQAKPDGLPPQVEPTEP